MKSTQSKQHPNSSKKMWAMMIVLTILAGVAIWAILAYAGSSKNYAREVVTPLENALVKGGAVKKCSYGDAGKGPDNRTPWLDTFYEAPIGRDKAIELINTTARDNGYSLTHASKDNRGNLNSVADEFINNWYFDNSKASSYGDLQGGQINVAFGLSNDGSHSLSSVSCGTKNAVTIDSGDNITMITLSVKLPEFRR